MLKNVECHENKKFFSFGKNFVLHANYCTISTKYKTVLMLRNVLSEELASQSPDNHQNLNTSKHINE